MKIYNSSLGEETELTYDRNGVDQVPYLQNSDARWNPINQRWEADQDAIRGLASYIEDLARADMFADAIGAHIDEFKQCAIYNSTAFFPRENRPAAIRNKCVNLAGELRLTIHYHADQSVTFTAPKYIIS